MDIQTQLLKQASVYSDKPAIIFEDKEITFTPLEKVHLVREQSSLTGFTQLKDDSFKLVNYFLSKELRKSEKIALFLPNNPFAVKSYLAVLASGNCLVPLDFMLTEEEIINIINHSEARIFIAQPKKGIDFLKIKDNCPSLEEIITCKERIENVSFWDDILANSSKEKPEIFFDENSLSSIFYTSGSTGHPKGVMLTYKHLDNPINCIKHFLKVSDKDIPLCCGIPFSHIGGFDYIILPLYFGQTLILMERFNPLEFLKTIEKYNITWVWLVPSMYSAILSLKECEKFNLSSLRYAVVFGAPSSPVLLKLFNKLCPNAYLLNGWGMTETSAPNCVLPPGIDKIESIGKFAPGMEAKIVDDKGDTLVAEQRGELLVKGEAVMTGYYKEEELTKEVITGDGWLKTGDIAYYDKDGLFYIAGRKKDIIKVAGEIVFSAEIEEKIQHNQKVKESAVIGVSDKLRGEVPCAFVVLKEGENLDEHELREFLREHLAHFKIPHYFEFVKGLPKTRIGKVDKQALKSTKEARL